MTSTNPGTAHDRTLGFPVTKDKAPHGARDVNGMLYNGGPRKWMGMDGNALSQLEFLNYPGLGTRSGFGRPRYSITVGLLNPNIIPIISPGVFRVFHVLYYIAKLRVCCESGWWFQPL